MLLVRVTASLGLLGVGLGAFGAHGLRARVAPELIEVWKTGVLYHLLHTLALLGLCALGARVARVGLVAGLWLAGIAVFSGSLYVLVLGGPRWLGAVTPLGGLSLMAGWLALAFSVRRAAGPPV